MKKCLEFCHVTAELCAQYIYQYKVASTEQKSRVQITYKLHQHCV